MPYDSRTELLGIVARHADDCPARTGGTCRCGPLGYRGGVWDWQASMWVRGPVLRTAADARDWQREAHRLEADALGPAAVDATPDRGIDEANSSERLWWWAFCYVGLGIFGVALALSIAGLGS